MSSSSIGLNAELQQYLLDISLDEPDACKQLREQTLALPEAQMISSPEQVQLLVLLLKMLDARRGLEVGTFTGYTSLRMTLAIEQLQMTCCDVSKTFTDIAREHWRGAGVQDRIDLQLAPALKTIKKLIKAGLSGQFDFVYIDADKVGYQSYLECCLQLVRSGGLITLDNVLWNGSVVDVADQTDDTCALRNLNHWLYQNAPGLYDLSVVPIGDGLTILRKY